MVPGLLVSGDKSREVCSLIRLSYALYTVYLTIKYCVLLFLLLVRAGLSGVGPRAEYYVDARLKKIITITNNQNLKIIKLLSEKNNVKKTNLF